MRRVRPFIWGVAACGALAMPALLIAAETITYTYDARGRLKAVERSGTVNAGVKTEYKRDKAHNRVLVKTTGSPNPSGP